MNLGTILGAGNRTIVGHKQGKHPTCYPVALAPRQFFLQGNVFMCNHDLYLKKKNYGVYNLELKYNYTPLMFIILLSIHVNKSPQ